MSDELVASPNATSRDCLHVELERARLHARAWSDNVPESRRVDSAAVFVRVALEAFADVTAPRLTLSRPLTVLKAPLNHATAKLAQSIGRNAGALPVVEGLYFVTSLYPAMLPPSLRGSLGAFYTPPVLTKRLLDQATEQGLDWGIARVLDPAAGGGAFLLESARRLRGALGNCEPAVALHQISTRLLGLELDSNAATLAQWALEILLAELAPENGQSFPPLVRVCNSLEEAPCEAFDLVVGNPPYGRVNLTGDQRRRYARSLYGHANLYGIFTDIALRWVKTGGFIAYLTPTSFLSGQYYRSLRELLAQEAPPVTIDFVHARRGVFEDVLQETLLALYRKVTGPRRAQVNYLHVANEREARVTKNGTIGLPGNSAAPWLAPRTPEHASLITRVECMTARLLEWGYSVSTGPLVWNRFKPQLRERADGKAVHPLIWAETVTADGRFVFRAQKRNHAPYFQLEPGDDWLLVKEPCILLQRTTAKEQPRRLIAAEMPAEFVKRHGGVVVENHLNMIRPSGKPKIPPAVVAAVLNSDVVDQVFRCMNGSVAVSAFELEALPLPDPAHVECLTQLVVSRAERGCIEAECRRLYRGDL